MKHKYKFKNNVLFWNKTQALNNQKSTFNGSQQSCWREGGLVSANHVHSFLVVPICWDFLETSWSQRFWTWHLISQTKAFHHCHPCLHKLTLFAEWIKENEYWGNGILQTFYVHYELHPCLPFFHFSSFISLKLFEQVRQVIPVWRWFKFRGSSLIEKKSINL